MKHVLFYKILMIFFVFGAGIDIFNKKYKGGWAVANAFVNVAIAIVLGIGICWLP